MSVCTPWITSADLVACGCPTSSDNDQVTPDIVDSALMSASEVVYMLTAQQWPGECEATVRPCTPSSGSGMVSWPYPYLPVMIAGDFYNFRPGCGCHTADDCGCTPYPRVDLGRDDITGIVSVDVGADTLGPGDYRLDSGRWLIRTDGSQWPCCQNMAADLGTEGTWSVTYTYGRPVPTSLREAAARLATEMVKGCVGDDTCRIPNRATTVTREGVTYALLDPQSFLTDKLTGLWEVDLAIKAFNPDGVLRRARILSPETSKVRAAN